MTREEVGTLITLRREMAGMSQKDLGDLIGKDARSISSYESGKVDIKLSVLIKITEALGISLTALLTGEKKPAQKKGVEIRVYQLEDRMAVAQILVKNGYTVSQVKRSNGDGKTVQYRLKLEESDDNIRIVK